MIALMLPSYERLADLTQVLDQTPLDARAKFIVVANYAPEVYQSLVAKYADRAIFVNERDHGNLGGAGAYGLCHTTAIEHGFDYVIHYADDVLPADANWLDRIDAAIIKPGHPFGIFSSDECHHGTFGWNVTDTVPIAHFYVMRTALLGPQLFDSRYLQYVVDLDLAYRVLKAGHPIHLMPIRLQHYRSPINRTNVGKKFEHDAQVFYQLHPGTQGWLHDERNARYIPEDGQTLVLPMDREQLKAMLLPWPANK